MSIGLPVPISHMIQVLSLDPVAQISPVYSILQQFIYPLCYDSLDTFFPVLRSQIMAVLSKEQVIA